MILPAITALLLPLALGGPVDFGRLELRQAVLERNLPERSMPPLIEVSMSSKPESFEIAAGRISGGDVRGLMYGLLEAAAQIRARGRLTAMKRDALVPLRSARIVLDDQPWEKQSFHSREYWTSLFQLLARSRVNRLQLVFGSQGNHWAPLYPHLFSLPLFPDVEVEGVPPFERGRNMDTIRMIAQVASEYAVDFAIGISSHPTGGRVRGLTPDRVVPYFRSALEYLLSEVPAIRAVRAEAEPGILRDVYFPAVRGAGRLVTLELRDRDATEELRGVARDQGLALRLIEEMPEGAPLPPWPLVRTKPLPSIRFFVTSRWPDPEAARLAARCMFLGAQGLEFTGSGALDAPETALAYSTWGRGSFDSAPAKRTAEEEAIAAAGRLSTATAWAKASASNSMEVVQRLHGAAGELERALAALDALNPLRAELETAAQRGRLDARQRWTEFMEAYYEKTKHASALMAARNEARGVLRIAENLEKKNAAPLAEALRAQLQRLDAAVSQLPEGAGAMAFPWTPPPRGPTIVHKPWQMVFNDKPLAVPVTVSPVAGVISVRLHYRMLADADFRVLQTSPRNPNLTIPAGDLAADGTLIYYFEVQHAAGSWFDPDPLQAPPVYTVAVRDPPVTEEPQRKAP